MRTKAETRNMILALLTQHVEEGAQVISLDALATDDDITTIRDLVLDLKPKQKQRRLQGKISPAYIFNQAVHRQNETGYLWYKLTIHEKAKLLRAELNRYASHVQPDFELVLALA